MKPLISVIVPIYNVGAYLPRCLESIVGQTYGNLEIILVDDGSADGCGEICDRYAGKDHRIRVIHQENRGVSAARNTGLDRMTGEYLMFVDADDWISPDAVQILYDRIQEDGSDMAMGKKVDVYGDQTVDGTFCDWMTDVVFTREELTRFVADTGRVPVSAAGKLYKHKIFDNMRFPQARVAEDLAVFSKVLEICETISISQQVIYYYFQRQDSVMHQLDDDARLEQLNQNLLMLRHLAEKESIVGVSKWFGICIDIVYHLQDRRKGMAMIEEFLTPEEVRLLRRRQCFKAQVKWVAIHHAWVGKIVSFLHNKTGVS